MGQCSEMSPEGAKGYVTVTVRWARGARRVFPEGAEELDLERNGSASCNGASECRVGPDVILYPRDETALKHGAGVEQDTPYPQEAYARFTRPAPEIRFRGEFLAE